jgi:hypothetical protein
MRELRYAAITLIRHASRDTFSRTREKETTLVGANLSA